MNWEHFIYFAIVSVLLWATGAYAAWKNKTSVAYAATIIGLLVFFSFIVSMWISLERPPLRTMGETRLWYSFFLPMTGIIVYSRWKYKWILSFSTILALVFVCVNLFKPEIHDKTLMPALQSPWFAPHVIVYMFAYAVLGAATVIAIYLLFFKKTAMTDQELNITDNLVCVGLAFMTVGMLFGSLWAKEAWGHYWSCPCGPRRHGAITGRGIPKRRGQPSPGSLTWSTSTIDSCLAIASIWPCGYCSYPLCSCRCAGGASITCPQPKEPQYIPTRNDGS